MSLLFLKNDRKEIFPSTVPPVKIKVKKEEEKTFQKIMVEDKYISYRIYLVACAIFDGYCDCCKIDQYPVRAIITGN
jgi:hypothetical protein